MVKALVFDLDGTLIDSAKAHAISWYESFKIFGYHVEFNKILSLIGLPGYDIVKRLLGQNTLRRYNEIRVIKDRIYLNLLKRGDIKLFNDVVPTLNTLKNMGLKLGLASSTPSYTINIVLNYFRLKNYFDVVVPGDAVKRGKPYPDIFIKAFNELKVKPTDGCVVGDSEFDIVPAKNIGALAILVTHGLNKELSTEPDYVIKEISELVTLIKSLLI